MLRCFARHSLPLLIVAVMVSASFAQGGRGPGGRGPGGFGGGPGGFGGGGTAGVLMDPNVRTDLGLSDDQIEKIREISRKMFEGMGNQFQGLRDLSEEERNAKLAEIREGMEKRQGEIQKEIDGVLSATQRDRLKQIQVQSRLRGSTADGLASKELSEALGLSDAQKEELKKVQEDAQKEMQAQLQKLQQEAKDKVLKVLTADQKAKLEKLMGAKVEFSQFGGRGPGGQGGPGGPGGRGGRPAGNTPADDGN